MSLLLTPPPLSGEKITAHAAAVWELLLDRLEAEPALTARQAARIAALVEDYTRQLIARVVREE